jgi:hypothetical protein
MKLERPLFILILALAIAGPPATLSTLDFGAVGQALGTDPFFRACGLLWLIVEGPWRLGAGE